MKNESPISKDIRIDLGGRQDTRLFRNNVGTFIQTNAPPSKVADVLRAAGIAPRFVAVGLMEGSSDLVGWHSRIITADMVGSRVAIFTAIETKRPGHHTAPERLEKQMQFINIVQRFGGLAGIATSVEEARAILGL
jgi:hypothetical protein